MKKTIYIILMSMLMFLPSCQDFLNTSSDSTMTEDFVYEREGDTFRALLGAYTMLTDGQIYGQRVNLYFPYNTDIEVCLSGSTLAAPSLTRTSLFNYTCTPDESDLYGAWNNMYITINRANEVVAGMEGSSLFQNSPLEPNSVRQMYGEAKGIRALMYLELIRNWGDVPMKMTPTKYNDNFYIGQSDRDTILTFLINDLIAAEPYMLPASELTQSIERMSRQTIQGLIVRLALTRGGWSLRPDYNDPSAHGTMARPVDYLDYYRIANEYARKVYDSKTHSLLSGFHEVFYNECQGNTPSNDDVMYEIGFVPSLGGHIGNWIGWHFESSNFNAYGNTNQNCRYPLTYFYSFDKDDSRRMVTCCVAGYQWNSETGRMEQYPLPVPNRLTIGKWSKMWTKTPLGAGTTGNTGINWPIMRYADILLLLAETENELNNGPTSLAKECLKTVRKRAFSNTYWTTKVDAYVDNLASKEDFFNALVDERAWEFGGEAVRKYDLIRWNLLKEKLSAVKQTLMDIANDAVGNGFGPGKYTFPAQYYYKKLSDGTLDYKGFDENIASTDPQVAGYTAYKFLASCVDANGKYTYYGQSWNDEVLAQDPVVYIYPIHTTNINDSQGALKNYYGK